MHIVGFLRVTKLRFVKKEHEGTDTYSFFFSPSRPLKHIAGQHGLFILPRLKGLRIFSLSSAPSEEYVRITTRIRKESSYKQHLYSLKAGDEITLCGPVLDFIFTNKDSHYVFLAQGIGITPFRSLLVEASIKKLNVTCDLIHVDGGAHMFRNETESLANWSLYPTNPLEFTDAVNKTVTPKAVYYISGSPKFVQATKQTLRTLGVKSNHVKSDSFFGY